MFSWCWHFDEEEEAQLWIMMTMNQRCEQFLDYQLLIIIRPNVEHFWYGVHREVNSIPAGGVQ